MTTTTPSSAAIPAEDLTREYALLQAEIHAAIDRVLPSGRYTLGPILEEFERQFATYCGTTHAVGMSSGTAALQLALAAMGVGPGDEVITQANTYVATAFAVSYLGAKPVFVDVEPEHGNLDVAQLESRITPRTKVVIPVHLYGHAVEMDPLMKVAEKHGLRVLEDASHAHGALYKGRRVGSLGHAAAFSFYPSKVLGAYGDAGGVVTNDPALDHRIRILRYMGQEVKHTHLVIGYQERLDPMQAAVLGVKLRHVEGCIEKRRAIARGYAERLRDLPLRVPTEAAECRHVYYLYTVHAEHRDALAAFLGEQGIATQTIYKTPVPFQPCYRHLGYRQGEFPVAERLASQLLNLPMFPDLREDEVDRVAAAVRAFYTAGHR
ncbi:MAG: DegT/DnrJ/EryC1/StrS family aminotransferase [Actinobacteria bacterium]|nr:DegT/DnrJ/EryC1/StrS family aminotransferase [Actinomycetota bacterium]